MDGGINDKLSLCFFNPSLHPSHSASLHHFPPSISPPPSIPLYSSKCRKTDHITPTAPVSLCFSAYHQPVRGVLQHYKIKAGLLIRIRPCADWKIHRRKNCFVQVQHLLAKSGFVSNEQWNHIVLVQWHWHIVATVSNALSKALHKPWLSTTFASKRNASLWRTMFNSYMAPLFICQYYIDTMIWDEIL